MSGTGLTQTDNPGESDPNSTSIADATRVLVRLHTGGNGMPDEPSAGAHDVGSHPKGTLAIVAIYGLLFLLGWLVIYFFVFVPRGTLTQ